MKFILALATAFSISTTAQAQVPEHFKDAFEGHQSRRAQAEQQQKNLGVVRDVVSSKYGDSVANALTEAEYQRQYRTRNNGTMFVEESYYASGGSYICKVYVLKGAPDQAECVIMQSR